MPRKLLKRIIPDQETMQGHPHLQRFGKRITEPRLWHLNKRAVAGGLALGLFISFMPILGQMVVAASLAIILRVNLPVAVVAVWLSNPLTAAPLLFFAYKLGVWILQIPMDSYTFELSWQWFSNEFLIIWQPLLLGCLICGIAAATVGIVFVRLTWRLVVIRSWLMRQRRQYHQIK